MDDWTRMYVGDEIAQAGYQGSVVLGEAVSGAASVVVCEATRRGTTALFAFGFEATTCRVISSAHTETLPVRTAW